jgi:hypothetical protein
MEALKVLEGNSALTFACPHLNAIEGLLWGHIEMDDEVRLAHKIRHILEEADIRLVVALVHQV